MGDQDQGGETRDVALFLGAGASAALGYLLTREIAPAIAKRVLEGPAFQQRTLAENVGALNRVLTILGGLSRDGDGSDITELLSLIDHCILEDEALDGSVNLIAARQLLEKAIAEVLDRPFRQADTGPGDVMGWIERAQQAGARVTIISTNYDTSLDLPLLEPLLENPETVDFGFAFREVGSGAVIQPPNTPALRLYKLHGALNWLKCLRCSRVYVNLEANVAFLPDAEPGLWNRCHCGHSSLNMLLVAPSYVRGVRDPSLRSVWQQTYEALRKSATWLFVGYSLPPEDIAIRALLHRARLSRGAAGDELRVAVYDPSKSAIGRYRAMFPAVEADERGLEGLLTREAWSR
jgi:hypothetical protein